VRLGTDTGVGLVMVVAAAISRGTKRLLRISDETVDDPWCRRHDTSGLSSAIHWLKPGLVVRVIGGVTALVREAAQARCMSAAMGARIGQSGRSSSHLPDGLGRSDLAAKNVFDSPLLRQT
jgi:hypothetical protein